MSDDTSSPVAAIAPDESRPGPQPGIALCLSGGGYRAMLFHLGALWRLNDLGFLPRLERISSVSGGSITAGVLALHWSSLEFDSSGVGQRFRESVVEPIRRLAGKTIDARSIIVGALGPGSIGEQVAGAYDKHLFRGATLQDLPERPRFVINATNVQSGGIWRFMKPYMRDYRVGEVKRPTVALATAVAASAAFPPFLSPVRLKLEASQYSPPAGEDLHKEPFTTDVFLTDGGVYDNLGLETAWKRYQTVLVSDAGGQMQPLAEPKADWIRQLPRILDLIDNQVRSLRKRQVIGSYVDGTRGGAYWGIRTNISHYELADALSCPEAQTKRLASEPTRLRRLESVTQDRLINWGYAVCDAAMRKHVDNSLPKPDGFPEPNGVG